MPLHSDGSGAALPAAAELVIVKIPAINLADDANGGDTASEYLMIRRAVRGAGTMECAIVYEVSMERRRYEPRRIESSESTPSDLGGDQKQKQVVFVDCSGDAADAVIIFVRPWQDFRSSPPTTFGRPLWGSPGTTCSSRSAGSSSFREL